MSPSFRLFGSTVLMVIGIVFSAEQGLSQSITVVNPKSCVTDQIVEDTCPGCVVVTCPVGRCTNSISSIPGCWDSDNNWTLKKVLCLNPERSVLTFKEAGPDEIGKLPVSPPYIICKVEYFCWCKSVDEKKQCVTSEYDFTTVIIEWQKSDVGCFGPSS